MKNIKGYGQTAFNGVTHALDGDADPICGTPYGDDGRLYNDVWPACVHVTDISCRRCLRVIEKAN